MHRARLPVVILAMLFAAPLGRAVAQSDAADRANRLEARVHELELKLDAMRSRIVELEAERNQLRARIVEQEKARLRMQKALPDASEAGERSSSSKASPEDGVEALKQKNEKLRKRNEELAKLAGLSTDSEREARGAARVSTVTSDEGVSITTTAHVDMTITHGSRADHVMRLLSTHPDAKDAASAAEGSVVWEIRTGYSSGDYGSINAVTLEVDGEAIDLPAVYHDRRARGGGSRRKSKQYDETLLLRVPPAHLAAIAEAKAVSGKLRHVRFELTADQIALFRAMKLRLAGAASDQ